MTMAARSGLPNSREFPLDGITCAVTLFLLTCGLIMVGSASTEVSDRTYGDPFYLAIKHGVYIAISLGAGGLALLLPIRFWQRVDWLLLLASFMLLILVLIPGVGHTVNGSTRWIHLGFFTVQGSEFVKLFTVIYVAGYLVRHNEEVHDSMAGFIKPLALVGLMLLLLLEQPDFGAAVVIMAAVMGMIFLAGVPFKHFLPMITVFVALTFALAHWQPYRLERLTSFADPWAHQFEGGYQLTQALIALGRGEWFGLGLGNSIQKLFFLPEAHTDFLFSILAEETGVFGASIVIAAFLMLVVRGLQIGRRALVEGQDFHAYVAYGISMLIGFQALINIGVNIGMLPTKGLTLPLVSFGGNSLIVSCLLVGILLRVAYEIESAAVSGDLGAPEAKRRPEKSRTDKQKTDKHRAPRQSGKGGASRG